MLLAAAPVMVRQDYMLRILTSALMYGTFAMAFDFTGGFINVVNFGFSAFWGLGGYGSGLLAVRLGLPLYASMVAGALIAGVAGFVLSLLTMRLRGLFASCMAWFFALSLFSVASNWTSLTRGFSGLSVPRLFAGTGNLPYYYAALGIAFVSYQLFDYLVKSPSGLAFQALGQDYDAAQSLGISPFRYRVMSFTVSCAVTGFVGAFYAHFVGVMTPKVLHTSSTVEVLALAFVGGRASLWGGLLCAVILVPLFEYLRALLEVRLIAYGVLLICSMVFFPEGVAGVWNRYARLYLRRFSGALGDRLGASSNSRSKAEQVRTGV